MNIIILLYHYLVSINAIRIHESICFAILRILFVVVLELALEIVVGFEQLAFSLNRCNSTFQGHLKTGQATIN